MHEITLARLERMKRGESALASRTKSITIEDHTLAEAILDIHKRLRDLEELNKEDQANPNASYKTVEATFDGTRAYVLFEMVPGRQTHKILGVRFWDEDDPFAITQEWGDATEAQWLEGHEAS